MTAAALDTQSAAETLSDAAIAFFSSGSGNTARLAERLALCAARIPARQSDPRLVMTRPFVLITPSFADAEGRGAVPAPVVRFLNDVRNRTLLKGVIGSGNRNFGELYALGGRRVAAKCDVPFLYSFELAGTDVDVSAINNGVSSFLQTHQYAA